MKYAVRMVLIPESEYLSLNVKRTKGIKSLKTRKAFIQLTQDLGKKIRQRDQVKIQQQKVLDAQRNTQKDPNQTVVDLVQHLPSIYHKKGKLTLDELQAQGFSWKQNKEITVPSGQTLTGSNIVDLLKEALVPQRKRTPKPSGWTDFIRSIASSGVPQSLFTKQGTKRALQQAQVLEGPGADWEIY